MRIWQHGKHVDLFNSGLRSSEEEKLERLYKTDGGKPKYFLSSPEIHKYFVIFMAVTLHFQLDLELTWETPDQSLKVFLERLIQGEKPHPECR